MQSGGNDRFWKVAPNFAAEAFALPQDEIPESSEDQRRRHGLDRLAKDPELFVRQIREGADDGVAIAVRHAILLRWRNLSWLSAGHRTRSTRGKLISRRSVRMTAGQCASRDVWRRARQRPDRAAR